MVLSAPELRAQRRATAAFIDADPTTLVLTPHSRVKVGGTYRLEPQPARSAQKFKLVWTSDRNRPIATLDGQQMVVDLILVGTHEAAAEIRDQFVLDDGRKGEVIAVQAGFGYEQKFLAVIRG